MKSKLRVINGHGGTDPGAVVGANIERDLNIAAVLSFNDVASREYLPHDVTVITYPAPPAEKRDGNTILLEKIDQANLAGADQLLIEVHHNIGAADPGTQLWYSQNANGTAGDETWQVLAILQRELGFLLGTPIPTLSSDRSRFGKLGILDDTTCTAILIEARNVALVVGPDWEYSFGIALAKAMASYFGWPPAAAALSPTLGADLRRGATSPSVDARALIAAALVACPAAAINVTALATIYAATERHMQIRADVALAQAIHETGRFTFPGTVKADWNNFAGVGVTSSSAVQKFPTMNDGVLAHLAHLRWYAYPDHGGIAECSFPTDPRHNVIDATGAHANSAHTIGELAGKWAPGADYGIAVAKILDELRATITAWTPPAPVDDGRLAKAREISAAAARDIAAL